MPYSTAAAEGPLLRKVSALSRPVKVALALSVLTVAGFFWALLTGPMAITFE